MTDQHRQLLYLIQKCVRTPMLPKELGISRQLLNYRLRILEREGYITQELRDFETHYLLTSKGNQAILSFAYAKPLLQAQGTIQAQPPQQKPPEPSQAEEPTIRPHAFEVKFPLKKRLPKNYPAQVLQFENLYDKPLSLQNQDGAYFKGEFNGLLTDTSLILYPIHEYEAPIREGFWLTMREPIANVFQAAAQLEQRLNIELRREARGFLAGEVVKHEIALKNHQIAKDARENDAKLYCYDPDTKELIIITDFSNGFPEWEAVHKKSAPYNAEEMVKASTFMGTGRFREWAHHIEEGMEDTNGRLEKAINLAIENTKGIAEERKFEAAHNELVREVTELQRDMKGLVAKLDASLAQQKQSFWRRLFKR